ncbi:MAG: precorrin-6y C5,15-methyltransferase (decarboxylating) subunit CbiE [Marinifilaceae bacterium]|jgi:cobalt-precorrin-7 (C5)-methyltransferase|nr:precorrin-6y C5,15-methyltransferase (decarboxylating) subunit CbiE [Marinifilaceae bacterium]
MNKIVSICGIGPGNPDYILPKVFKSVDECDLLIGAKRHLEIFENYKKNSIVFDGKLSKLLDAINTTNAKFICVLASGDTGFYSIRKYLSENLVGLNINLIPGISSFQYLYSAIGLGYENALLASLHGKELNFIEKLKSYDSIFLLTDRKWNYKKIAEELVKNDYSDCMMYIGSNLSYDNEKILICTAREAVELQDEFNLCSVIIKK